MLQIITPDFRKKIEMLVSKHGSANALGNARVLPILRFPTDWNRGIYPR